MAKSEGTEISPSNNILVVAQLGHEIFKTLACLPQAQAWVFWCWRKAKSGDVGRSDMKCTERIVWRVR
jgi:hypothetical protein